MGIIKEMKKKKLPTISLVAILILSIILIISNDSIFIEKNYNVIIIIMTILLSIVWTILILEIDPIPAMGSLAIVLLFYPIVMFYMTPGYIIESRYQDKLIIVDQIDIQIKNYTNEIEKLVDVELNTGMSDYNIRNEHAYPYSSECITTTIKKTNKSQSKYFKPIASDIGYLMNDIYVPNDATFEQIMIIIDYIQNHPLMVNIDKSGTNSVISIQPDLVMVMKSTPITDTYGNPIEGSQSVTYKSLGYDTIKKINTNSISKEKLNELVFETTNDIYESDNSIKNQLYCPKTDKEVK